MTWNEALVKALEEKDYQRVVECIEVTVRLLVEAELARHGLVKRSF